MAQEYREDFPELRRICDDAEDSPEGRQRAADILEKNRRRLESWLQEIDPVERDPGTGLPIELVTPHRALADDVLGSVPVSWTEARANAYLNADPNERTRATMFIGPGHPDRDERDWRWQQAWAPLNRIGAVGLIQFAHEDDSEAARQLRNLWSSGELRDLLGRFLDARDKP